MASGDIKLAPYGALQTMTTTNLQSLASSQTAGWQSDAIDNTANLYEEIFVLIVAPFANTAPANDKELHVYAYGGVGTTYANPFTGSEGTLTVPTIASSALNVPEIGKVSYNTQAETAIALIPVSPGFGGIIPPKVGFGIINFSGAALAASGVLVKWFGVFRNVSP